MRLPTVTLRNRNTGAIRKVNQSDYGNNLIAWSSNWERIGETRGEGNEMVNVNLDQNTSPAPPAPNDTPPAGENDPNPTDQLRDEIDKACKTKRDIEERIKKDLKFDPDLRTYNTRDKLLDLYIELHEKKAQEAAAAENADAG